MFKIFVTTYIVLTMSSFFSFPLLHTQNSIKQQTPFKLGPWMSSRHNYNGSTNQVALSFSPQKGKACGLSEQISPINTSSVMPKILSRKENISLPENYPLILSLQPH